MTVNSKLTIGNFGAVTETIADAYFDENGVFTPHYAYITAMRLFYDYCVTESEFDDECPRFTEDISKLDTVFASKAFTTAFCECIDRRHKREGLTFSAAYYLANEMACDRKSGVNRIADLIRVFADGLSDRIIPFLKDENIEKLTKAVNAGNDTDTALNGILKQYNETASEIDKELKEVKKKAKKETHSSAKKKKTAENGDVK